MNYSQAYTGLLSVNMALRVCFGYPISFMINCLHGDGVWSRFLGFFLTSCIPLLLFTSPYIVFSFEFHAGDICRLPLSLFFVASVLNAETLSKYPQIKAAVLQYDSVKAIFNFRFGWCAAAGCSGGPALVCLVVWTGCKRTAGRNVTAETEFLRVGME